MRVSCTGRLALVALLGAAMGCQGVSEVAAPLPATPTVLLPPLEAREPARAETPPAPDAVESPPAPVEERVARLQTPFEAEPVAPERGLAEERGFIGRDRVNFRPCPEEHARCAPIAVLRLNEEVRVLGQEGDWLWVRVARLSREGYVVRRFVAPAARGGASGASARGEPASVTGGTLTPTRVEGAGPAPARGSGAPAEELLQ